MTKLSFYYRTIPLAKINITSVLLSYNIEVINALTSSIAIPILIVYGIHPLPYHLAQTISFIIWSLAAIIPAIGIAMACFQILYVTKFSTSFAWSPEKVGKLSFIFITMCCVVPNLLIIIDSSWKGDQAAQPTAFFSGQAYLKSGLTPLLFLAIILDFVCAIVLAVSYVIIPYYMKHFTTSSYQSRDLPAGHTKFNLKRLLFAIFSLGIAFYVLIAHKIRSDDYRVSVQAYVLTFILTFILLLLLLDKDIFTFIKRHFWKQPLSGSSRPHPRWQTQTRVFVISNNHQVVPATLLDKFSC